MHAPSSSITVILSLLLGTSALGSDFICPSGSTPQEREEKTWYPPRLVKYCERILPNGNHVTVGKQITLLQGKIEKEQEFDDNGDFHGRLVEFNPNGGIRKSQYYWHGFEEVSKDEFGCRNGKQDACTNLARALKKNGSLTSARKAFESACKKGHQPACDEIKIMESEAQAVAKRKADQQQERDALEKKESSVVCKIARIERGFCNAHAAIKTGESIINHENEVGARSGYVNANRLRQATSSNIIWEKQVKKLGDEYKALSGKSLSASDCQITTDDMGGAKIGEPARSRIEKQLTSDCGTTY